MIFSNETDVFLDAMENRHGMVSRVGFVCLFFFQALKNDVKNGVNLSVLRVGVFFCFGSFVGI